jgi:hypothetical protein
VKAAGSQHREIDGCNQAFRLSTCAPSGDENQAYERNLKQEPCHQALACRLIAALANQAACLSSMSIDPRDGQKGTSVAPISRPMSLN